MSCTPTAIRRLVLEEAKRAHVGHIGSALSVADVLAVLYSDVLKIADPGDPDRDRFILSKGHAALALYAALHLRGWLTRQQLTTYCGDDSHLGVHPENALRGVDFSTGSLGQGLSMGVGAALAARMQKSARRVYVLVSDAECNEGSLWEAVMFAAHHKLANLIVIVDANNQQALARTSEVLDINPLAARWRAFNWRAEEVDGHDPAGLKAALTTDSSQPKVIIAKTLCGKGVDYMEGQVKWHYWPMSPDEYASAVRQLAQAEQPA